MWSRNKLRIGTTLAAAAAVGLLVLLPITLFLFKTKNPSSFLIHATTSSKQQKKPTTTVLMMIVDDDQAGGGGNKNNNNVDVSQQHVVWRRNSNNNKHQHPIYYYNCSPETASPDMYSRPFNIPFPLLNVSDYDLTGRGLLLSSETTTTTTTTVPVTSSTRSRAKNATNAETTITTAICEFDRYSGSRHFPHAMQQILRCWSYWQTVLSYNNNRHTATELLLVNNGGILRYQGKKRRGIRLFANANNNKKQKEEGFLIGVLNDLKLLGVQLIEGRQHPFDTNQYPNVVRPARNPKLPYLIRQPSDLHSLASQIRTNRNIVQPVSCCSSTSSSGDAKSQRPRIGILTRDPHRAKRAILNAEQLAEAIQTRFFSTTTNRRRQAESAEVVITDFEQADFRQQIEFFTNQDIVISSHGAQLTGLFFMPTKCASVLELFPASYYLLDFYGSLAECSNVRHYSLLLSNVTNSPAVSIPFANGTRSVNLCPRVEDVLDSLEQIVVDWIKCCEQNFP